MASPQLEKGFLRLTTGKVDNDLVLALARHAFSGCEYAILLVVIRKTYGWAKKDDWVAVTQFVEFTGRSRRQINDCLRKLKRERVLLYYKDPGNRYAKLSLNKDFHSWLTPCLAENRKTKGTLSGKPLGFERKTAHTKETNTKETNILRSE